MCGDSLPARPELRGNRPVWQRVSQNPGVRPTSTRSMVRRTRGWAALVTMRTRQRTFQGVILGQGRRPRPENLGRRVWGILRVLHEARTKTLRMHALRKGSGPLRQRDLPICRGPQLPTRSSQPTHAYGTRAAEAGWERSGNSHALGFAICAVADDWRRSGRSGGCQRRRDLSVRDPASL